LGFVIISKKAKHNKVIVLIIDECMHWIHAKQK
jgi:hypothetical protein